MNDLNDNSSMEKNAVKSLEPSAEMLWQLEQIRQFFFGVLRLRESRPIESDFDQLLGTEALAQAQAADFDASPVKESRVINYSGARDSSSFVECTERICSELKLIAPEAENGLEISGHAIYLRGSYMGWHSNHSRSDGRIYCSWAESGDSNFFRYQDMDSGEIVTNWEQPGWNIKLFHIPKKPARFWHCIGAKSLRLSLGFRFPIDQVSSEKSE